jgi:hypothetical protein
VLGVSVMEHSDEQPLFINTEMFLASEAGAEAVGLAMDLLFHVYWPLKQAFVYDPETLATTINRAAPERCYDAYKLKGLRKKAAIFFTELDDGRWAPSPIYCSLTDGNTES